MSAPPSCQQYLHGSRLSRPLGEHGIPVTRVELSRPMIEQLRTKVDEAMIQVVVGDMATARVPGRHSLSGYDLIRRGAYDLTS